MVFNYLTKLKYIRTANINTYKSLDKPMQSEPGGRPCVFSNFTKRNWMAVVIVSVHTVSDKRSYECHL